MEQNKNEQGLKLLKPISKKQAVLQALHEAKGIVSIACSIGGIGRTMFYEWKKHDAAFASAVENIEEFAIDHVESKLLDNIEKGLETSILFYLKTKGKKRGYIEKNEIGINGNLVVNWHEQLTDEAESETK